MDPESALVLQLIITLILSVGALATSGFVIFQILYRETRRLNEAEKHAFELYDAIFQSLIPRTLGDKLLDIYRTEVNTDAMMNDKPIPPSAKQLQASHKASAPPPTPLPSNPAATPNASTPAPIPTSTPEAVAAAPAVAVAQAPALPE